MPRSSKSEWRVSSVRVAIADTSALFAAADRDDQHHRSAVETFERIDLRLVIPAFVAAETAQMIGARLGARSEAKFFRALTGHVVEPPASDEWVRIAELVETYADFPLGGTDASVLALAERYDTETVITFDRRHFTALRPRHCEALELLPA